MNRGWQLRAVLFLIFVCCMIASFRAIAQKNTTTPLAADPKQEVLDLGQQWVAAENKHDATTLGRILDDKFVASFGTGKPYAKEAFIKLILSDDVDPTESQTLTDETVLIDGDTAVVVGTDTDRGTGDFGGGEGCGDGGRISGGRDRFLGRQSGAYVVSLPPATAHGLRVYDAVRV